MRIELGDDIVIREFDKTDVDSLVRAADNPNVAALVRPSFPSPYTKEDALGWIETTKNQDPLTSFAIATVDDGVIGGIGLDLNKENKDEAELGYWLGEQHWGNGIATRAVLAFLPVAFEEFGLKRIVSLVYVTNRASLRVLEKAGFQVEKTVTGRLDRFGRIHDQFLCVREKEEN
jgi:RimJ/RimL family protein N-acetyltransferase